MSEFIEREHFTKALLTVLGETCAGVEGYYLDANTSLLETVADISAAEASRSVGGRCATLAAQVKHTAFFLDFVIMSVTNSALPPVDWGEIWRTVGAVTDPEWQSIQADFRASYQKMVAFIEQTPAWPSEREIAGALAVLAHTAYHLGEIRQALCVLRP